MAGLLFGNEMQQRCYASAVTQLPTEVIEVINERSKTIENQSLAFRGEQTELYGRPEHSSKSEKQLFAPRHVLRRAESRYAGHAISVVTQAIGREADALVDGTLHDACREGRASVRVVVAKDRSDLRAATGGHKVRGRAEDTVGCDLSNGFGSMKLPSSFV